MSLAQGNNTPTRPRIEPGSPDPESDALTTRPVRPPNVRTDVYEIQCPYKQPFPHNIAMEFVQAFIKLDQLATLHSISINV